MLLALVFGMIMIALNNALFFDGYAEDGAFQLLNPLRRIMNGGVPGRDFVFFHGVAVPLIHLPSYLLFGQGIFGEEMTRWTVSPVLFALSAFCFFYAVRRRLTLALGLSTVVTVLGALAIPFLVFPITSILGVRSVLPVFLLAIVLNQRRMARPVVLRGHTAPGGFSWYELVVGVMLGVAVVCGTEFGMAAVLAFFITHITYRVDIAQLRERAISAARVFGVFIVALFVLLSLITLGHPWAALQYAFIDIPSDQLWYFGVPPNTYLSWNNIGGVLMRDWLLQIMLAIALLAVLLIVKVHRHRKYAVETQTFIYGWLAGLFAMVSMLGYYSSTEAAALVRMSLLIIVASIAILAEGWRKPKNVGIELGGFKKRLRLEPARFWRVTAVSFVVVTVLGSLYIGILVKQNFDIFKTFRKAKDYVTGVDTNVLSFRWQDIDQSIIPVIQADNNIPVVDINDNGFTHGINTSGHQIVVDTGTEGSFIHHGQIVYLPHVGRQVIASAQALSGQKMIVTIQDPSHRLKLDPSQDGAPAKMIVAEDFKHDNSKVWSFYTGVLNQEMGLSNPANGGYDYIIHGLGQQRRQDYVNEFQRIKPQFVTTFTYSYFGWEGWLENEHWDLYSLLDKNYEVVKETSIYSLWKRKDQAWANNPYAAQTWQPLAVDDAQDKITLPKPSFDALPDVEAYGRKLGESEIQHQQAAGLPYDKHPQLDQEQYDSYLVKKIGDDRLWNLKWGENRGPETLDLKAQLSEQRRAQSNNNDTPELHIPRPKRAVVLVKLHYKLNNPSGWVPILNSSMRFMIEMNNVYSLTSVSLRPYANTIVFPVVVSEFNDDPYLRLKTYSLLPVHGDIVITDAQWLQLDTSAQNLKDLTD